MSTWCDYYCARVVYILLCGDDVGILYDMVVLIVAWWLIYDSTTVIITQPIIISCSGILPRRTIISIFKVYIIIRFGKLESWILD